MSKKEALRDLQERLAERLQQAQSGETGASWLAVISADRGFLFPLQDAGEIFPLSQITSVPHTASWFVGVASLRGQLHSIVDLGRFLGVSQGHAQESARDQVRLITLNVGFGSNAALLVDQLAGLRRSNQMTFVSSPDSTVSPEFVGNRYKDQEGQIWQEIKIAQLIQDEYFLQVNV